MHESSVFKDFVANSVFDKLPKETQELLNRLMLEPMETTSDGGSMASEGASLEVVSVEVLVAVPKSPRSPRLKCMLEGEASKMKKDKQKAIQLTCESLRKHHRKEKRTTQEKVKVVNPEANKGIEETYMGTENIDIEGVDPISKLPEYIPLHQGKVKALKDPDEAKFLLNTPLLRENITLKVHAWRASHI